MATITIKDLSENLDLDRKAMQSVMGGSRLGSQVRKAGIRATGATPAGSPRIVDFKTGAGSGTAPASKTR
jgi:hypothetical protein